MNSELETADNESINVNNALGTVTNSSRNVNNEPRNVTNLSRNANNSSETVNDESGTVIVVGHDCACPINTCFLCYNIL